MDRRELLKRAAALGLVLPAMSRTAMAGALDDAKAYLDRYQSRQQVWDGPTTGPKAAKGKFVTIVANDLKNSGVRGAVDGAVEAAKVIGWETRVLDGAGSVSGRTGALDQAIALKSAGILIVGLDPVEHKPGLEDAEKAGIKLVAWHSVPATGPIAGTSIVANVTSEPLGVPTAAADWAYVDAGGKPAVVIFTDSNYSFAIAKSLKMKELIEKMGGTVLSYEDMPIADVSNRMGQLTVSLLQRYGAKWTHSLAINDIYYDFMAPALASVGLPGEGAPKAVAAGDGSVSAYQRIRAAQYQAVTVAEPLALQGWQLVDEMNRAFAGQAWSGYIPPFHVVTKANIDFDGGKNDVFDPQNGYRDRYRAIWGV